MKKNIKNFKKYIEENFYKNKNNIFKTIKKKSFDFLIKSKLPQKDESYKYTPIKEILENKFSFENEIQDNKIQNNNININKLKIKDKNTNEIILINGEFKNKKSNINDDSISVLNFNKINENEKKNNKKLF